MEEEKSYYSIAGDKFKLKEFREVIKNINEYLDTKDYTTGIDAMGLFMLAKSYNFVGNIEESIRIYKTIILLNDQDVHARLELGKIYSKQGNEEEAEQLFKKIIEVDPENIYAMLQLGKLYVKLGREDEAEKMFRERLRLEPRSTYARLELGKLFAKQGKAEKAETMLIECTKLNPNNPYVKLELGRLYAKQGKKDEAKKLFKEIIKFDPTILSARFELGKLLVDKGKSELNRSMYQYLLDEIGTDQFDQNNRIDRLMQHTKDDLSKEHHGVFAQDVDLTQILELVKAYMVDENKRKGYLTDVYVINVPECGYQGGRKGDKHTLDYITVVSTIEDPTKFITLFPSDNILELGQQEKKSQELEER